MRKTRGIGHIREHRSREWSDPQSKNGACVLKQFGPVNDQKEGDE